MAKVKCKYCGKKIDENLSKYPKCKKSLKDKKVNGKVLMYLFWLLIQCLLCFLLYTFGKESWYSGQVNDLYFLIVFAVILLFNSIVVSVNIYKNKKRNGLLVLAGFSTIVFEVYALIYGFNITKAFFYENSSELQLLAEVYDLGVAKEIKNEIENVFERDSEDTFSRDIIINNFYTDGEISSLYIDDAYGNYKLKFYVDMDDNKIKEVYSEFDDYKLYLVKDGEKTNEFEFYYAMNILNNVLGEDIKGLARIDSVIEEEAGKSFSISSNAMFNYEELEYDYSTNTFSLKGDIYNMDYSGGMEEKSFLVTFSNNVVSHNRKVWYYGDSSFDYVNWNVNM